MAAPSRFEIDAFKKHCLLNGLDGIGLTMEKAPAIDTFEEPARGARLGLSALATARSALLGLTGRKDRLPPGARGATFP